MRKHFTLFSAVVFMLSANAQSQLELPSIFGDNMVLQQNSNSPLWGKANPGAKITISTNWNESVSTNVNDDSTWQVNLPTPKAGGPYRIKIESGDNIIYFKNVLIGEVWLCSGQSNMEMPMLGWPPQDPILNSEKEIENATHPEIRLFTVTRNVSFTPVNNVEGEWKECRPSTAADFSATAYFFGKKLHQELKVPIGLIHSSWGGTPAEAWTNKKHLSELDAYKDIVNKIENSAPQINKFNEWLDSLPKINMQNKSGEDIWKKLDFKDSNCSNTNFDDSDWKTFLLPLKWEQSDVGHFDGVVWFRKNISIPESWTGKSLQLELGPIDDFDATFVNGKRIGGIEEYGHWQTDRIYEIPADITTGQELLISVRVIDTGGGGGLWGDKEKMKLINKESGKSISLAGNWKFLPVAEYRGNSFYIFGEKGNKYYDRPQMAVDLTANTATALYNAMIAPLIPFQIRGAIWYQGESNAGRSIEYETLFPTMIRNWRNDWGYDFPFYFTQIAPYNYGHGTESQYLRDAQRKTLSLKNTGMAVTLDIGNNENIHPANKKDVGERLALWALANDYDKNIVFSGPLYKAMKITGSKIKLDFDFVGDGLLLTDKSETGFLIAGKNKKFTPAKVKLDGNSILVWSEKTEEPLAVRYAWSDTASATLFNKNSLPASSFRTDDW